MLGYKSEETYDDGFITKLLTITKNYVVENGKEMNVLIPGFADDTINLIDKMLSPVSPETVEVVRSDAIKLFNDNKQKAKDGIDNGKQELENRNLELDSLRKIVTLTTDTTSTDSTNVKKPDVPPTPTIKEGTASEEDKISFKDYLKDDKVFNAYNKIDQGDKPGVIIIFSKEYDKQTLYKDSEGIWSNVKRKNNN